jgi:peptidyl-prolyl cis-trans isomerase C
VLAIVNGRPITQRELDVRWAELPEARQAHYQRDGGKKKFLDDLITRELLLQEARRLGLDRTPEVREKTQRFQEQLALDALMRELARTRVQITPEELDAYYQAHAATLLATTQVRAAQIIVPTAAQAFEVKKQLEEGADFAKLAQKVSIDQATKFRGGDLGPYRTGMVPPAIETAILTQPPGAVSEPIKVKTGYALVKVLSRDPLDSPSLEVIRERLKHELIAEKQRQQYEALVASLRRKATLRLAEGTRLLAEASGETSSLPVH